MGGAAGTAVAAGMTAGADAPPPDPVFADAIPKKTTMAKRSKTGIEILVK